MIFPLVPFSLHSFCISCRVFAQYTTLLSLWLRSIRCEDQPLVPHIERKDLVPLLLAAHSPTLCFSPQACWVRMSDQGDAFAALLLDSELFESFLTKRCVFTTTTIPGGRDRSQCS